MARPLDSVTVGEARDMLRVTRTKMAQLINEGKIPAHANIFDKRTKLIRLADLEAFARAQGIELGQRPKETPVAA